MVLACYICNFNADNKKSFEKHINSEEHKKNLIVKKINIDDNDCEKCLRTFSTKGNRAVHQLKCKGTLNYNECEYCHKIFVSPIGKSQHRQICKKNPINITNVVLKKEIIKITKVPKVTEILEISKVTQNNEVKNQNCITLLCEKLAKYDNKYCTKCYYFHNPDKAPKFKENKIYKFLTENFKDIKILYNKQVKGDGKCLKIRPDFLINFNHHSLIIECDENQHRYYPIECVISRIYNIQEILNRPLIVIMFNPDEYVNENNQLIKSCFDFNQKLGLTTISSENIEPWYNRLMVLKDTIESNMTYDIHNEPIKIIKLFYDDEQALKNNKVVLKVVKKVKDIKNVKDVIEITINIFGNDTINTMTEKHKYEFIIKTLKDKIEGISS